MLPWRAQEIAQLLAICSNGRPNHQGDSVNRRCEREQRVITSRSGALQNRTEGNEGNEDFSDNVLEPILVFLVSFVLIRRSKEPPRCEA